MHQKVLTDSLPKLGWDGVKRLNAYQDKFASHWLNVVPCKNLYLGLSNQVENFCRGVFERSI